MESPAEKIARVVQEKVAIVPPFYAWFIKRDEKGSGVHHSQSNVHSPGCRRCEKRERLIAYERKF